jgi:hypothetical protein
VAQSLGFGFARLNFLRWVAGADSQDRSLFDHLDLQKLHHRRRKPRPMRAASRFSSVLEPVRFLMLWWVVSNPASPVWFLSGVQ